MILKNYEMFKRISVVIFLYYYFNECLVGAMKGLKIKSTPLNTWKP